MGTANARLIRRVPGRLVKDPTDLSIAFPFGGTPLGIMGAMEFRPAIQTTQTQDEMIGRTIRTIVTAEQPVFAGVLRDFDGDLVKLAFLNSKDGDQGVVIKGRSFGPGTSNRAGFNLRDRAIKLLFSPLAIDSEDHILMYHAVTLVDESAALQLSIASEKDLAMIFEVQPDPDGRDYDIGRRDDLEFP